MLIMTGLKLELLYDLDMLNMKTKMKRGGLCFVGRKRCVKANNQHLPDHDPKQPSNYKWYGIYMVVACLNMYLINKYKKE